jgi:predicted AlkP superfamily pyrophosphatase or phosphodiesterase
MTSGSLKHVLQFCLCICAALSGHTFAATGSGGVNAPAQLDKPYLILISIDGLRWDYPELFPTPAMHRLAARGVRAESMLPVFPTQTFPNHYSIVTGLYPAHHGIVANEFRDDASGNWYVYKQKTSSQDGRWYGGEPVWVAAEKAGMVTAAFFFVGTEAVIQGIRPTYWRAFDKNISGKMRVEQVLEWLREPAATRPHFYTLYFEDVDDNGHWHGPTSAENAAAVAGVDSHIQLLVDGLATMPYGDQVTIVLLSDHGQSAYKPDTVPFIVSDHFDLSAANPVDGGPYTFLYFDQPDHDRAIAVRDGINRIWDCGQAWLPEDTPGAWQVDNNPRFADVFLLADPGCAVLSSPARFARINRGDHGWPPEMPEMRGIFMAAGPALPAGLEIGPVRAIDIYPLLMRLLGLEPRQDVDSDPDFWTKVLP